MTVLPTAVLAEGGDTALTTAELPAVTDWVKDRAEPAEWKETDATGAKGKGYITSVTTEQQAANSWYDWQGRSAQTKADFTNYWVVETELVVTESMLETQSTGDGIRASIWVKVDGSNIGADANLDWAILQFCNDGEKVTWQWWDSQDTGNWIDVEDVKPVVGSHKLKIEFDNGVINQYIDDITVHTHVLGNAYGCGAISAASGVILESRTFGESYSTTWKIPTVQYAEKYDYDTIFVGGEGHERPTAGGCGVVLDTIAEGLAVAEAGDTIVLAPGEYDVTATGTNNQIGSSFIVGADHVTITAADPANKPVIYGFSSAANGVGSGIAGQNTVTVSGNGVTLENLKIMLLAGVKGNTNEYQKALEVTANDTFTMTGCEFVENTYQYEGANHALPDGYAGQVSLNISAGTAETVKISDCIFTGAVLDPRTPMTVTGCTFNGVSPVHKMAIRSRYQNNQAHSGTVISGNKFLNIGEGEIAVYGSMDTAGAVQLNASGNYWGEGTTEQSITGMVLGAVTVSTHYSDEAMNDSVSCESHDQIVTNGTYLASALKAAKAGDTIVLSSDATLNATLEIAKEDLVIDGNGHTISCGAKIKNGALLDVVADNVTIQNVTVNANDSTNTVKHGVQFYCVDGGKLDNVTVNGGIYTAVIVNGAKNIVLEDCALNSNGYANLEYAMGGSVDGAEEIPSFTVDGVTFKAADSETGAPLMIWADNTTVANLKTAMGGEPTDDQILAKIEGSITNRNTDDLTVTVLLGDTAESLKTVTVDGYTAPSGGSSTSSYTITVTQSEGGKITPSTTSVKKGSDKTFTITANEGYKISDVLVDGKSVGAVSTYTFENVKARHTITAKFEKVEEITNVGGFTDVKSTDWFADAVQYVVDEGLMNGTSSDEFTPNGATTRGMIVTILYRQAGSPAVESDGATWWPDARVWAMENGVSDGANMDKEITREQLATMLYRYAGEPKVTGTVTGFTDAGDVSDYAANAMAWAIEEGLINGMTDGTLKPQSTATRAQVAAIFSRFATNIG